MNKQQFIKSFTVPQLATAVINQLGGWIEAKETMQDIANHGINGGYGRFVFYSDTVKFAKRNRKAIQELAAEQADSFGTNIGQMIASFGCLRGEYSENECLQALYGNSDDQQILNALAWYAGEEVSRHYVDMLED